MLELIQNPWPWYVAGPLIALTMFLLLIYGKKLGLSSNLRTMCTIGGAGRFSEFFRFDAKAQSWNLLFLLGTLIGGFIAATWLKDPEGILLSTDMVAKLSGLGFEPGNYGLLPAEIFGVDQMLSLSGMAVLVGGGVLVGFGARYAGGCTSGHAISGLSDLQWPSLLAVVGFFVGGLLMTHLFLPIIFQG